MKHPTDKRRSRSWLRRVVRGFWRWVEDCTRLEVDPQVPGYEERKARAVRGINREGVRANRGAH